MKEYKNIRGITGNRAARYLENANKLMFYKLASPKERCQYFDAVKTLRSLSDKYCEITGLPYDLD